jgi:hypothetical protein
MKRDEGFELQCCWSCTLEVGMVSEEGTEKDGGEG